MGHKPWEPFKRELAKAESEGVLRRLRLHDPSGADGIELIEGSPVISFGSNDYLGLTRHPAVKQAAVSAVERYGWGSGASRLVTGHTPPHEEFENRIAAYLSKPAALLYSSGYAANVGVLTALLGRHDAVYADRLLHASIIDGARFSGASLHRFSHNDPESLRKILCANPPGPGGRRLVATEGVFSMDGDLAPLKELALIAKEHGALFMVDDAHGVGLFGLGGKGVVHLAGVEDMVDIHIITLGKAFGGMGGVVAASQTFINGLVNYSRSFIYSTAAPPATASAATAALDIIESPEGERLRALLWRNVDKIVSKLKELCYDIGRTQSQIVPIIVGREADVTKAQGFLLSKGTHIPAIRPPTVPKGTARFRMSVTAGHTEGHLDKAVDVLSELKPLLG
ncbi:MAG: 8-amino-7-oxononanoate synthase [Nitrospinae bacterium]|nr:8-amino-7-oxononanoate synthase [Nitrospinota bacterium]